MASARTQLVKLWLCPKQPLAIRLPSRKAIVKKIAFMPHTQKLSHRQKTARPRHATFFGHVGQEGCGGCQLQHLKTDTYRQWKRNLLTQALNKHGIDRAIDDEVWLNSETRWRARWHVEKKSDNTIHLGYYKPRSHDIMPIDGCLLITPVLQKILKVLPNLCAPLLHKKEIAQIHVTDLEGQIDLIFQRDRALSTDEIQTISTQWQSHVARVSYKGKNDQTAIPIYAPTPLYKSIGTTERIKLEPDTFLQASHQAERAMQDFIATHLATRKHKHIIDLFCGIGTLSLGVQDRLPKLKKLVGFDSNPRSIASFCSSGTQGQHQDLHEQPLLTKEFKKIDAVIIDPPRIGAKDQFRQLALAKPKTVMSISCHPDTFARDTKILLDAGYKIDNLTLLDQFIWSTHLEVMAVLTF